jgi:prenyltransferase beta subunit
MTLFPFDVFETAWVIDNFLKTKLPVQNHYSQKLDGLYSIWNDHGISMSKLYDFQDLDDTATVFYLFRKTNHEVDAKVLEMYEDTTHFNCYPSERSASPIVNIRVLKAINDYSEYNRRDEVIEKIIKFLYQEQKEHSHWIDKWNISPFYCTGQAIEAIGELDSKLTEKAVDWILDSQNIDGSWGLNDGTQEETSYAVLALLWYHLNIEKIDTSIINSGLNYLENNYQNDDYPELWLGKGLYCPFNVVKASIIAAMFLSKKIKAK